MSQTVIQHVLSRLHDIGIGHVFGVPGDYSFAVSDAVCDEPHLQWVGCCNELNAAYAADGYARIRGAAALSTTFGVGELSAINGVAGAYAEHLPLFHLVGMPGMPTQAARALMHHTLGDGQYDTYRRMSEPVVCAHAVMTPRNVVDETERLIAEALYHRRPVYMGFAADLAVQPARGSAVPRPAASSDPKALAEATDAVLKALGGADSACALPGMLVQRIGARAALQHFVDASGLPFATMFMAKSVLDEQHRQYVGLYDGALMNEGVRAFVEGADRVLVIGSALSDFNTGAFTARLDPRRTITLAHHHAVVDGKTYAEVELGELLQTLAQRVPQRRWKTLAPAALGPAEGRGDAPITVDALYPRWQSFLKPEDIVVAETGTVSMGLGFARLPRGASFHNQTLWGSIGWATAAALGVALAAPSQRVLLFTGEGSHQLTAQEIGQFGRLGLKPIVFVLNNGGYLIERLLNRDPAIAYNDVAAWRYSELPHAMGCDGWFTARVATCGELDAALQRAATADSGVYIEVMTDAYAASPLAQKLGDGLKALRRG
jgi:indolepyruvate decarboxylase